MVSFQLPIIGRCGSVHLLAHILNLNGQLYAMVVKARDTDVNPYCDLNWKKARTLPCCYYPRLSHAQAPSFSSSQHSKYMIQSQCRRPHTYRLEIVLDQYGSNLTPCVVLEVVLLV